MKKMKKVLSVILAAALAFSLAACNGGGGGSGGNPVSDFEYKYDADLGGIVITKYIGTTLKVSIPKEIEGEPVKKIGPRAFKESDVMEVNIPNGVTRIDYDAFIDCYSLTSITIPDSVTNISTNAFLFCENLTKAVYKGKTYSAGKDGYYYWNLPDEFYDAVNGTNTALAADNRDTSAAPAADNRNTSAVTTEVNNDVQKITTEITYETIEFGGYEWRVLERQGDKALVISEKILESRAYQGGYGDIIWENCDLRAYLNGEFYNSFSAGDRAKIIQVTNENPDNPWYGTDGGADTNDYIFLLSLDETVRYFGDSGQLKNRPNNNAQDIDDEYNENRIAYHAGGIFVASNGKTYTVEENSDWHWWLRSPGRYSNSCVSVDDNGIVRVNSKYAAFGASTGVRPAMWISLE